LDLPRASVTTNKPVQLQLTGDGPTTLTLRGSWPHSVSISRDGQSYKTVVAQPDRLSFTADLTSSSHTFTLTPTRQVP
jgi:hypothetical protein